MKKIGLLIRINRLEVFLILVCISLFVCAIYSSIPCRFPARYPDFTGETLVRLDYAYYQIWGYSVQFYATLSESSEPFEGDYYVLLVNTNENPATSIYNETKTLKFRWRSENGSIIYHNTTISIVTTPINSVVEIGDTINFDIRIQVEEDLLFEFFPLSFYEDLPKFQLERGLNILSIEARFACMHFQYPQGSYSSLQLT